MALSTRKALSTDSDREILVGIGAVSSEELERQAPGLPLSLLVFPGGDDVGGLLREGDTHDGGSEVLGEEEESEGGSFRATRLELGWRDDRSSRRPSESLVPALNIMLVVFCKT
jgi:hypothetical protein